MLCRLCFYEANQDGVALFCNGAESNLTKMIAKYMQIEVLEVDSQSNVVCKECDRHLNEFHAFCQYVEQRRNVLQNQFLEVKCIVTNTTTEETTNLEQNEMETLLDIKDVIEAQENNFDDSKIQNEFSFAERDSLSLCKQNSDEFSEENAGIDLLKPLRKKDNETRKKIMKRKGKCATQKEKPIRATRKTVKIQKVTPKVLRMKSKTNKDLNEQKSTVEKEKKTTRKIDTPEENKMKNDIIAKYMSLKCNICQDSFENFSHLQNHFRKSHDKPAFVSCCGKHFYRRFKLVEHIQVHLNPDHFKCQLCGKVFKTRSTLETHNANIHIDKSELKHACPHCDRRFASAPNLEVHLISHTNERTHICEICNKAYKSVAVLKKHISIKHSGSLIPQVCEICGKEYKSKQSFDRHVAEHQGKIDEPMKQCNICLKWLSAIYIKRHALTHKKVNVNCNICGKNFQTKSALSSHLSYKHKPKGEYSCTFCDKKFERSSYLKEHINRHTGEKYWHCKYCPRNFLAKSNMYGHMKKTHFELWRQAKLEKSQILIRIADESNDTSNSKT